MLDLAVAVPLLVVSAPVVGLAALAVRLESPGHPIYKQRRVGFDGHAFEVYKLRTMVSGAERMGAGMAVDEGDSRITRIGALLRRTSTAASATTGALMIASEPATSRSSARLRREWT